MRKLSAIKFITDQSTIQSVLELDLASIEHDLIRGYVGEIRELCAIEPSKIPPDDNLSDHTLRLKPDGTIEFFNKKQEMHLEKYLRSPREMMTKFLKPTE